MAIWIIVRKLDLEILGHYEADAKDDTSNNRSHLHAEPQAAHIELLEELDPACLKCEMVEDEMVLSEDADKVTAKEAGVWASVRADRDARLLASDKYVLTDYPISPEDLQLVKDYRQALRDLPEELEDPSEVVWPEFPL